MPQRLYYLGSGLHCWMAILGCGPALPISLIVRRYVSSPVFGQAQAFVIVVIEAKPSLFRFTLLCLILAFGRVGGLAIEFGVPPKQHGLHRGEVVEVKIIHIQYTIFLITYLIVFVGAHGPAFTCCGIQNLVERICCTVFSHKKGRPEGPAFFLNDSWYSITSCRCANCGSSRG